MGMDIQTGHNFKQILDSHRSRFDELAEANDVDIQEVVLVHMCARAPSKRSPFVSACQTRKEGGIGRVHRYPLAELKCVSPKRRREMAARLGGEPGGAGRLESLRHGRFRSLFRSGA